MAPKIKRLEECTALFAQAQGVVSYAHYFAQTPLFTSLKVENSGADAISELVIKISNENGLLVPFEKKIELLFESTVEVHVGNLLSPAYFAALETPAVEEIAIELKTDKKTLHVLRLQTTALPFDCWEGTGGNLELLGSFVRPKLADCARLKAHAVEQLKKWDFSGEVGGYDGVDKNAVRMIAAALFSAFCSYSFNKKDVDITRPVALETERILREKVAAPIELALLFAGVLESVDLHPVLAVGEKGVSVGVWLYDSCFIDGVSDDTDRISKYISDGINNVSFFDVEDLFVGKNAAYSTSETHFSRKLSAGVYERFIDIRRLRIGNIYPMPLRVKSASGFEILSEKQLSPESAPEKLIGRKALGLSTPQSKNKQWERRLLDLSMKNALLNFHPEKTALHLLCDDGDELLRVLEEKGGLPVYAATAAVAAHSRTHFNVNKDLGALKELIKVETASGVLRSFAGEEEHAETLSRLMKKGKEAGEESGAVVLYLALGFLKWYSREDGKEKFAPLVLQSVRLKKAKGGSGFEVVVSAEERSVNSTLLEFLKQEFNIDVRGLEGQAAGLKISEILAMVRMEVVDMKNWKVYDDVYLSSFAFAGYQMWQDVRRNMAEFSLNPIVSSLLHNRSKLEGLEDVTLKEDETSPLDTLMPLPADQTQWEAIALSRTGKSFVLHGPPGTGKSQTITNIIANALLDNKRVLFGAEKQAALSVVKKRIDGIGLGDFCLELHSGKTSKADVLQKLSSTLALAGTAEPVLLNEKSENIKALKADLLAPLIALHKKRRLGVSVYEAMLLCLKHRSAPEIMNIESTFYDGLTEQKIDEYKRMMTHAASAAKECGGVCNSPFDNVNLTEYSREKRDGLYCASEVVIAEIKHLKNYLALFLELYRQRISSFTRKKLAALKTLVQMLLGGAFDDYVCENEDEFHVFFAANRQLDACLETYQKSFKKPVDCSKEWQALGEFLTGERVDYTQNKAALAVAKKLQRVCRAAWRDEDAIGHFENVYLLYRAMDEIEKNTRLCKKFTRAFGKVDFYESRAAFLKKLYDLHSLCSTLFMDYNPDSFNSMCLRAACGYTAPVLQGLLASIESFERAEESFLCTCAGDKNKVPEEDVLDYYTAKAGALIDNIDMLAGWCAYRAAAKTLENAGLTFITDALESGRVTGKNIIASFEKNIYKNFLQTNLPLDPALARFSAAVAEDDTENLRLCMDEFSRLAARKIRAALIARIPTPSTEGVLSLELVAFGRLSKSGLRGTGIRKLFEQIPELLKVLAPCMLMSPNSVSQYLQAENGLFDLVIFDEASQMPTAEAIGSLARAKSAIVVGDPKQLPPTSFFNANYVDEENLENEDMESVLDDLLALGVPQRHLSWHYRSKHESLIAFSNAAYYGNKLCTFPSPDGVVSKVRFVRVEDGVYDRGFTKRNKQEADALIEEVLARLSDPKRAKSSIGVVTFSSVQKEYIERRLTAAIAERRLEDAAYDHEEPLCVPQLENVQGDERAVILFSVCYGPDKTGKISLNFGPLNQAGGWRRLNVAVSRAREEMVVFSSMTGAMIDLSKTGSKGVAGLKAFLEFAEKGKANLAVSSDAVSAAGDGIGKYIAEELSAYGYDCRYDVGVSDFKIDVAVIDPKNRQKFILGILCDGTDRFSVKDRNVLQIQTLKRNNWNVARVYAVNYYNNPKREIKRIKDLLDRLTGADKRAVGMLAKAKRPYKAQVLVQRYENATFVTSGENDAEILARLKAVVATEEPISYEFLIRRVLSSLGVLKYGSKVDAHMQALVALCGFKYERILGTAYYRKTDKCVGFDKYRVETGDAIRKSHFDFTPYEVIAIVKNALWDKVALYPDEILVIIANIFKISRPSERFCAFINDCISLGEQKGLFIRSVSDRISLA